MKKLIAASLGLLLSFAASASDEADESMKQMVSVHTGCLVGASIIRIDRSGRQGDPITSSAAACRMTEEMLDIAIAQSYREHFSADEYEANKGRIKQETSATFTSAKSVAVRQAQELLSSYENAQATQRASEEASEAAESAAGRLQDQR